jgi:hypothetical protein
VRYVTSDFALDGSAKQEPIDQYAITRERTERLAETLVEPTRYLQRFVEQVAFLPKGGQQWTRTLQTRIPESAPSGRSWHIISLGQYARRRLPDFVATDASGMRLNLLTRRQHGVALTRVTTLRYIYSLPEKYHASLKEENIRPIYYAFRGVLYSFFTSAGDLLAASQDTQSKYFRLLERLLSGYAQILESIKIPSDEIANWLDNFALDFDEATKATRYLCWVEAVPNEVVNIRVLYTVKDVHQKLELKSVRGTFANAKIGFSLKKSSTRKEVWADWYRQFGLAPLNYAFDAPGRRIASYYFAIDPPSASNVTYLDWEVGNSLEDQEIDSAFYSAHIHSGDQATATLPTQGGALRAYIRCAPHHHKQILGVALFNLVLVFLLAKGLLLGRLANSAQGVLLAAPPILIAYLVRQQRHYYANTLRLQRLMFWAYLAISIVFLLTVAFSHKELGHQNPNVLDTIIGLALAGSSIGVLAWYLPLGNSYQNIVADMAKRRRLELITEASQRLRVIEILPLWQCYANAVHTYCTRIFRTALTIMLLGTAALAVTWHLLKDKDEPAKPTRQTSHSIQDTGTLTMTTWPSTVCKGCNINFRFAPSTEPNK